MAEIERPPLAVPLTVVAGFAVLLFGYSCNRVQEMESRMDAFDGMQQIVVAHHEQPDHDEHIRRVCREVMFSEAADRYTGKDARAHDALIRNVADAMDRRLEEHEREGRRLQQQIDGLESHVYGMPKVPRPAQ